MTESINRIIKEALHKIPTLNYITAMAMLELWPATDYYKNVPKSATELMELNWNKTGKSLRCAMHKVSREYDLRKYGS